MWCAKSHLTDLMNHGPSGAGDVYVDDRRSNPPPPPTLEFAAIKIS